LQKILIYRQCAWRSGNSYALIQMIGIFAWMSRIRESSAKVIQ
jgi:hypothetical protein